MRETDRVSRGPSISEGLWFFKSNLPAMVRAAGEFVENGIKLEVLDEEIYQGREEVKVRITGEIPEHGLSPYWRRVEELKEELKNVEQSVQPKS